MRFATWIGVFSLGLAVGTAPARAQQPSGSKAGSSAPAADAPKGDTGKPKEPTKEGGAGADSAGADKDAEKKPSSTGGYSWSDKPTALAKGQRRWKPKKKIDPNTPIATYPGFRMLADGSSQVWVLVTRKVSVTAATSSGVPTFVLVGAYVSTRNNTNALVTTWFETPLARARLHNDAAGAQLVLELREQVPVKHRVVEGKDGSMTVYVDLPKPSKSYGDTLELEPGVRRAKTGSVLPSKQSGAKSGSKRGPSP